MILVRQTIGLPDCTPGILILKDWTALATMEREWADNEQRRSCIPVGPYRLRVRPRGESQRFPYTHIEVLGVPGRNKILFHRGNWARNSKGCILPGLFHSRDKRNERMVAQSTAGLRRLIAAVAEGDDVLTVVYAPSQEHGFREFSVFRP